MSGGNKTKAILTVDVARLGVVLAVAISWSVNQSIAWSILHGCFGWFYVFYYALGYGRGDL